MNILLVRWSVITFVIGLFTLLSSGCVVPGDGYGYDTRVGVGIGLGYYEPYGAFYGGWGPGYNVGPIHGDHYRPDRGGGRRTPHVYRSAPRSQSMPSIPSRRRSGDLRTQP